jgi:hypothetical protein
LILTTLLGLRPGASEATAMLLDAGEGPGARLTSQRSNPDQWEGAGGEGPGGISS